MSMRDGTPPKTRPNGWTSETGATAVEYAMLVSFIAAIIFGTVAALGLQIEEVFANPNLHDALAP